MIAAVDATRTGVLAADAFKWRTRGFLPTFASPVMDDERLYTMDNSAIVGAFDLKTGAKVWEKTLGTLQKGSPVLADGKLYVGTENGKFYILRPSATGVEVLDEDLLGSAQAPEVDRRLADRRRRPRLRDVDGRDVCDWKARAAQGVRTGAQGAHGAQVAAVRRRVVQVFPYEVAADARADRDPEGAVVRREGQLHSRGAGRAVVGRSGERRGGCEGRLHRGEAGIVAPAS